MRLIDYIRSKGNKLPEEYQYPNISTWFIPYYKWLSLQFYRMNIPHELITVASIFCGIVAAILFAGYNNYFFTFMAWIFFHLKDVLDATDCPLARMTSTGHPIGRYLDTVGDFVAISCVCITWIVWMSDLFSGGLGF